jgi:aminoglycoside 6'-N-acetyltransferase I
MGMIERCTSVEQAGWLELRQALWPQSRAEHVSEMSSLIASPNRFAQFVAYSTEGEAVGVVEAALRSDYVNGARSSPVAFLEGLYVVSEARGKGIAGRLVAAVCDWARSVGCSELASDALLENETSHAVHRALGFAETERVVFFRKEFA